jgi:hypothetical protein
MANLIEWGKNSNIFLDEDGNCLLYQTVAGSSVLLGRFREVDNEVGPAFSLSPKTQIIEDALLDFDPRSFHQGSDAEDVSESDSTERYDPDSEESVESAAFQNQAVQMFFSGGFLWLNFPWKKLLMIDPLSLAIKATFSSPETYHETPTGFGEIRAIFSMPYPDEAGSVTSFMTDQKKVFEIEYFFRSGNPHDAISGTSRLLYEVPIEGDSFSARYHPHPDRFKTLLPAPHHPLTLFYHDAGKEGFIKFYPNLFARNRALSSDQPVLFVRNSILGHSQPIVIRRIQDDYLLFFDPTRHPVKISAGLLEQKTLKRHWIYAIKDEQTWFIFDRDEAICYASDPNIQAKKHPEGLGFPLISFSGNHTITMLEDYTGYKTLGAQLLLSQTDASQILLLKQEYDEHTICLALHGIYSKNGSLAGLHLPIRRKSEDGEGTLAAWFLAGSRFPCDPVVIGNRLFLAMFSPDNHLRIYRLRMVDTHE